MKKIVAPRADRPREKLRPEQIAFLEKMIERGDFKPGTTIQELIILLEGAGQ
jgi:hypothetical protein